MPPANLSDNIINRRLTPDMPKFKIWHSAGLMLTYWCPGRCACCYNFSGPRAASPATQMSVERALACWRDIVGLAGDRGKVHLTGGEPFGDYERLREIMCRAHAENLTAALEKIETNAYWCNDENQIRNRLRELKSLGLTRLQISSDIYHQEYIPLEHVRRAQKIARAVLGDAGVQVRWRDFLADPVDVAGMNHQDRLSAFASELKRRRERLVGRAAETLAETFPQHPAHEFAGQTCRRAVLGAAHVHIDGAGHVFIGTCVGIIAGRVSLRPDQSLRNLWCRFDPDAHPVFAVLAQSGPLGLLQKAEKHGYRPLTGYADKCHLCYHVRKFLRNIEPFSHYLGPSVCYGDYEYAASV